MRRRAVPKIGEIPLYKRFYAKLIRQDFILSYHYYRLCNLPALVLSTATLSCWYPQVKAYEVSDSLARWIAIQVQLRE